MPESLPVEPPSPVAVARELAALWATLPADALSYERGCLRDVHEALCAEPPDLARARHEAADGMAHAFRPRFREDNPAVWLLAACHHLLAK